MHVCMYVCCMYVAGKHGMYACMYVRVCMYVCVYMYVCMYVRTYICMYVCMYVCMYIQTDRHKHTDRCNTCTHVYTERHRERAPEKEDKNRSALWGAAWNGVCIDERESAQTHSPPSVHCSIGAHTQKPVLTSTSFARVILRAICLRTILRSHPSHVFSQFRSHPSHVFPQFR